ncbi:hypothetical protein WAA16_08265 [Bacillus pumilus]|uniref:hypothetical protein n=1 Tax=Bacillus pumilus TaxID=1408 RepID=UPI0030CC1E8A
MRNEWYKFFRHHGLDTLEDYADHVESTLVNELTKIDKYIETFETEEEKEFHVDRIYDEIAAYRDEFPEVMRTSLLISIFTYLEHELNNRCRSINKDEFKKYQTGDKGIERAKKFLKENSIDFPHQTKEWNFICDVREIRNCFAHSQGHINEMSDKSQIKIRTAIKSLGKDLISETEATEEIQLHKNFNKKFIKNVKDFLDILDGI